MNVNNAQFVCGENFTLFVKSIVDIKQGDEILCDYHWQLAVIDPADGFGESSAAIAAGGKCKCQKCDESRDNIEIYKNVMQSVINGRYSIWEKASAHVSQHLLFEYFKQMKIKQHARSLQPTEKASKIVPDKLLALSESDLRVGVGISEFSWRSILDSMTEHTFDGARLVQVSSTLGLEALFTALYKPELELSLSVMVSTRQRELFANDVEVALNTFRQCLLPTSLTQQATLVSTLAAPATVITPFPNCWSELGITHLVIGEGADGTPEALDLEFAKEIIDAAKETLVYVLTTSNDLQSHLLYQRDGWYVSGYRRRKAPVVNSLTGETVFFSEIFKNPKRAKRNSVKSKQIDGLVRLKLQLNVSGMESSSELLQHLEHHRNPDIVVDPVVEKLHNQTGSSLIVDISDNDDAVGDFKKRKFGPFEEMIVDDNIPVVISSMLNLTWGMVLSDRYFNQSAEEAGFAKPVKKSELIDVRETLKVLKSAENFGFQPPAKQDFKKAMTNWFIEDDKDLFGWYTDINISMLTTIVNTAIKASPLAAECVMLSPYFLNSESTPTNKWNNCFPNNDFKDVKTILVPANVTTAPGSKVKDHYALLQVDIPGKKIRVFDSLPAKSKRGVQWRFREYKAMITAYVNAMLEEEGVTKPWVPELKIVTGALRQSNCCDCGVFMMITALYIGMGRCGEDVELDFGDDGEMMRLFLASLFLDAATEGMRPPAPRPIKTATSVVRPGVQSSRVARKLMFNSSATDEANEEFRESTSHGTSEETPDKKRKSSPLG